MFNLFDKNMNKKTIFKLRHNKFQFPFNKTDRKIVLHIIFLSKKNHNYKVQRKCWFKTNEWNNTINKKYLEYKMF